MRESMLLQAYREHEWELLRFLARRLGSAHLASDIAHDLYLKLLAAADHPDPELRHPAPALPCRHAARGQRGNRTA